MWMFPGREQKDFPTAKRPQKIETTSWTRSSCSQYGVSMIFPHSAAISKPKTPQHPKKQSLLRRSPCRFQLPDQIQIHTLRQIKPIEQIEKTRHLPLSACDERSIQVQCNFFMTWQILHTVSSHRRLFHPNHHKERPDRARPTDRQKPQQSNHSQQQRWSPSLLRGENSNP